MRNNRKTLVLFDIGAVLLKLDYNSFFEKAAEIRGCLKEVGIKI